MMTTRIAQPNSQFISPWVAAQTNLQQRILATFLESSAFAKFNQKLNVKFIRKRKKLRVQSETQRLS